MIRKFIAAIVAVLINCVVLASFQTGDATAVARNAPPGTGSVVTLPAITVRPTRAQIEMLRHGSTPAVASGTPASGRPTRFN